MVLSQALPLFMQEVEEESHKPCSSPGLLSPYKKGSLFTQHFPGITAFTCYTASSVNQHCTPASLTTLILKKESFYFQNNLVMSKILCLFTKF